MQDEYIIVLACILNGILHIGYKTHHHGPLSFTVSDKLRGQPLIIWWGAWCGFSRKKFFFGNPPNEIFIFLAKLTEENFFITWFYSENVNFF